MKEEILKSGAANWYHGFGSKGGKLILTNETLYFEGHKVNAGKKEFEVELENITNVKKGFPNNLIIETINGSETFAVFGGKEWVNSIQSAIEKLRG